jgi:hypothetical protein
VLDISSTCQRGHVEDAGIEHIVLESHSIYFAIEREVTTARQRQFVGI